MSPRDSAFKAIPAGLVDRLGPVPDLRITRGCPMPLADPEGYHRVVRKPALGLVLVLCACSDDGSAPASPPNEPADAGAATADDSGVSTRPVDAGVRRLVSVVIDPDQVELVSVDGAAVEQTFQAVATWSDGTTTPALNPVFDVDPVSVGQIGPDNGRFVANGVIGGRATVTVRVRDLSGGPQLQASADVLVRLERTIIGAGAPPDAADHFAVPGINDPARSASLAYPLDGAVVPQNVFAADVQWLRGEPGDLFRIRMIKPTLTVTAYIGHTGAGFTNSWRADAAAWRSIAQTDAADQVMITVDRKESASGDVILAEQSVGIRFARAAVTGSVYYWDIAAGRIRRIDDGTADAVSFMPTPPVATDGSQCVGCHSVSTSGRYMAGRLGGGDNIGAIFDLTADLSANPPPTQYPISATAPLSLRWWFSSWSPDDSRLIVSTDESTTRTMRLYDPFSGMEVPVMGQLPTNATHPAWSPDGQHIAYVTNVDQWGGDFNVGDIGVIDVTGPDAFGAASIVHTGASLSGTQPGGVADSYPTWSPDSARIAFAHGSGCRSENDQAALFIMGADGSNVVRLDRAVGGPMAANSFQPRFSPFQGDGYFWLSFLSRRDYGNPLAGTRGTNRQQIWVTAIRIGAAPGEDPSSVPYWLPGQATSSANISAYWAPRACRQEGEGCSVGSECCSGDCRPGDTMQLVCSPPPPDRCRELAETCSTGADCCGNLDCVTNVCQLPL